LSFGSLLLVRKTFNGTVHALKNLAGHHLGAVVNELLAVPTLPHPDHVVKCFQGIAKDPTLLVQVKTTL
jgi:hypothetical protein